MIFNSTPRAPSTLPSSNNGLQIHVDQPDGRNHVRNALDRLTQHIVRHLERIQQRGGLVHDSQQPLVRDNQERIDMPPEIANAFLGVAHPPVSFILEGFGHDRDGQDAQFTRNAGHDRSRARPGAAAHAGGDKHHVGADQTLANLIFTFQRGVASHFRLGTGAEAASPFRTDLNLIRRLGPLECLHIRIRGHEIDPAQSAGDHRIDGVAPRSSDTDHFDANGRLRHATTAQHRSRASGC